jgi:hypothetical protein
LVNEESNIYKVFEKIFPSGNTSDYSPKSSSFNVEHYKTESFNNVEYRVEYRVDNEVSFSRFRNGKTQKGECIFTTGDPHGTLKIDDTIYNIIEVKNYKSDRNKSKHKFVRRLRGTQYKVNVYTTGDNVIQMALESKNDKDRLLRMFNNTKKTTINFPYLLYMEKKSQNGGGWFWNIWKCPEPKPGVTEQFNSTFRECICLNWRFIKFLFKLLSKKHKHSSVGNALLPGKSGSVAATNAAANLVTGVLSGLVSRGGNTNYNTLKIENLPERLNKKNIIIVTFKGTIKIDNNKTYCLYNVYDVDENDEGVIAIEEKDDNIEQIAKIYDTVIQQPYTSTNQLNDRTIKRMEEKLEKEFPDEKTQQKFKQIMRFAVEKLPEYNFNILALFASPEFLKEYSKMLKSNGNGNDIGNDIGNDTVNDTVNEKYHKFGIFLKGYMNIGIDTIFSKRGIVPNMEWTNNASASELNNMIRENHFGGTGAILELSGIITLGILLSIPPMCVAYHLIKGIKGIGTKIFSTS